MWTWKKNQSVWGQREAHHRMCLKYQTLRGYLKGWGYFISVLFYNKALPPATGALNRLIIHTHSCGGLEGTWPRGRRWVPGCLPDFLMLPHQGIESYHRVVETTFITRKLHWCGLCPFCEGPCAALGFILSSEIFMGRARAQELGGAPLLAMEPSWLSLGSPSSKSNTLINGKDPTVA